MRLTQMILFLITAKALFYLHLDRIKGLDEYDKALEIDLTYPDPYYNKGNSLAALGQDKEAIDEYDKALEIDPKDIETHLNKGNSLAALGQDKETIDEYNKALEIDLQQRTFSSHIRKT